MSSLAATTAIYPKQPVQRHSPISAALVIALHAAAFYWFAHAAPVSTPAVSVPMVVSLAVVSESAEEPKLRERVSPYRPRPLPTVSKTPLPALVPVTPEPTSPPAEVTPPSNPPPVARAAEPAPPEVIPPRFDAAYFNNPAPAYPLLSRKQGEQGRVLLRVFVSAEGTAADVEVRDSSGWQRLDRAAMEAVQRWRFTPAHQGAQTVGAWVLVPIHFSLSNRG